MGGKERGSSKNGIGNQMEGGLIFLYSQELSIDANRKHNKYRTTIFKTSQGLCSNFIFCIYKLWDLWQVL